jgi:hypothetical protein
VIGPVLWAASDGKTPGLTEVAVMAIVSGPVALRPQLVGAHAGGSSQGSPVNIRPRRRRAAPANAGDWAARWVEAGSGSVSMLPSPAGNGVVQE